MLYQKLLMGDKPYYTSVNHTLNFGNHRHPEAEFVFCLSGEITFSVDGNSYKATAGDMIAIAPMYAHEYSNSKNNDCCALVVEAGPTMLRSHFSSFTASVFTPPVKRYSHCTELALAVDETVRTHQSHGKYKALMLTACIYKLCALILTEFSDENAIQTGDLRTVSNIEKALELVRNRYAEPITVDDAAAVTGYGKSNFCKLYKRIVGETFHESLNRRRTENACYYLRETDLTVTEIAPLVGFSDAKTFCRVFGQMMGTSPGQFRKSGRS